MTQSKNARVNKGAIVSICKYCKNDLVANYEATMPVKPNGAHAFKLKLVRKCCK